MRPLLALLTLLLAAPPALAIDCRLPGSDCRLKEAAQQAGIQIGAFRQAGPHPQEDAIVAAENDSLTIPMYWGNTQPLPGTYDFTASDEGVAFAATHGLSARGHPLIWDQAGLDVNPTWLTDITDPNELEAALDDHISNLVGRYAGQIGAWDVVNEPIETGGTAPYDNIFRQLLGPDYIADVLAKMHAADPTALLFVNEIAPGIDAIAPGKVDAFLDLITDLVTSGAPIHGVGFQGHFFVPADEQALFQALRRVQDLGLIAELTEVDMPERAVADPAAFQRDEYYRVVAACLAVDACKRLTIWGVSDANTWLDFFIGPGTNPLLFDTGFQRKPAYDGVRDALIDYIPRDLSGQKLDVRDHATDPSKRRFRLVSKDLGLATAGPVAFGDLVDLGATVRLLNPTTGEETTLALPAAGWRTVGPKSAPRGYRYRDQSGGPCTSAVVRPGKKLSVRCRGDELDFTLDEPLQGSLAVEVRIADAPVQCFEFGGSVRRDNGHSPFKKVGGFRAVNAPATTRCGLPD